jgi:hypothetical protein
MNRLPRLAITAVMLLPAAASAQYPAPGYPQVAPRYAPPSRLPYPQPAYMPPVLPLGSPGITIPDPTPPAPPLGWRR